MNINVYEEIGSPNAEEMFLKAKVVTLVGDIIRSKDMTQSQVADMLSLTQPQISNILKGRFRDISLEKLIRILTALHHSVRISVDPVPSETPEILVEIRAIDNNIAQETQLLPA